MVQDRWQCRLLVEWRRCCAHQSPQLSPLAIHSCAFTGLRWSGGLCSPLTGATWSWISSTACCRYEFCAATCLLLWAGGMCLNARMHASWVCQVQGMNTVYSTWSLPCEFATIEHNELQPGRKGWSRMLRR